MRVSRRRQWRRPHAASPAQTLHRAQDAEVPNKRNSSRPHTAGTEQRTRAVSLAAGTIHVDGSGRPIRPWDRQAQSRRGGEHPRGPRGPCPSLRVLRGQGAGGPSCPALPAWGESSLHLIFCASFHWAGLGGPQERAAARRPCCPPLHPAGWLLGLRVVMRQRSGNDGPRRRLSPYELVVPAQPGSRRQASLLLQAHGWGLPDRPITGDRAGTQTQVLQVPGWCPR